MKKQVILFFGAIFVLTISSLVNSLAWYVSAREADVEQVLLGLETDFDLKLSTSGEEGTFYDDLIYDERDENGLKAISYFKPVSSMFYKEWLEEKPSFPKFMNSYNENTDVFGVPYKPTYAEGDIGYYSQEIYIFCEESHYITIDIDESKTNFLPNEEHNSSVAGKHLKQYPYISTEQEMKERLDNIIYSLRMSILYQDDNNYNYWIIDPYKNGDTVLAGPLDANFTAASLDEENESGYYSTYYDHNLNGNKEICFGEIYDRSKLIYKSSPEQDDSAFSGIPSTFNARHAKGSYALDWEASLANMELGKDVAIEDSLSMSEVQNQVLIPVYANKISKIVLSFYLEGWDKDNINETMDAGFLINLAFMVAPVAPPF